LVCDYKNVRNLNADMGSYSRISEEFPVDAIYQKLNSKKGYSFSFYVPNKYLRFFRTFNGIKYHMIFDNNGTEDNLGYRFSLSMSAKDSPYKDKQNTYGGVSCSVSDSELRSPADQMVDDFPLTAAHRKKLKNSIVVFWMIYGPLFH
jgi:hypothetical protein